MTRDRWNTTALRFAVAAALAAGLAAAPGSLGGGAITLNSAAAQSAGGSRSADDQGAAQPDPDSAAEGLEDQPGVRPIDRRYTYFTSLSIGTLAFQRYGEAAERNDLQAAGESLSETTGRPVKIDLVEYVNVELGVQTALIARQIAAAANDVPTYETRDEITSTADELASGSAGQQPAIRPYRRRAASR